MRAVRSKVDVGQAGKPVTPRDKNQARRSHLAPTEKKRIPMRRRGFGGLISDEQWSELVSTASRRPFSTGQALLNQGDTVPNSPGPQPDGHV